MERIIKITCIALCIGLILNVIWLNLDFHFNLTPSEIVTVVDEESGFTYEYNKNSLNKRIGDFIDISKVVIGIEGVLVFILAIFKHKNNEIKKRNALIILGILLFLILVVEFVLFAPIGNVTAD